MLVLARKVGEQVLVGDAVVTVLEAGKGRVKLGIVAPKTILVLRGELEEKEHVGMAQNEARNHGARAADD